MLQAHSILYHLTLVFGTLIAITSTSWFNSWIGLEVNLLALMPLMKQLSTKNSSESTIKYFIVQAMASSIFIFSSMFMAISTENNWMYMKELSSFFICSALLLKMGAAPFHFWLPEVMSGMNWKINLIITTWQKLAPMIIIYSMMPYPLHFSIIIILSSLMSGTQGLNQTCMRKILAYSSINHTGWMLAAILTSMKIWLIYFSIYMLMNFSIILVLNKFNIFYINQMNKMLNNKMIKFGFILSFLNLSGLPPFLGFLPKWLVIMNLINWKFYLLAMMLSIFTLMSLYFYMRIAILSLTITSSESMIKYFNKINYLHIMMNIISLTSLILCTFLTNTL